MNQEYLKVLLDKFKLGEITEDFVLDKLSAMPFEDIGYAKLDHHRPVRTGYPEVIYGEGKTPPQAAEIFAKLANVGDLVLCTRASAQMAEAIIAQTPQAIYHPIPRIVELKRSAIDHVGLVVVVSAGTSDIPVAEEASIVCSALGSRVERIYDVGVAGLHRLMHHAQNIRKASAVIAVAGMEGALPSVVAGLVQIPVIAVPTSVGYGASFGGLAALLGMLNSCANGVSVVNIDNGFGAAVLADMINKRR